MKPENIKKANQLVRDLSSTQAQLDEVVFERERLLDKNSKSNRDASYLELKMTNSRNYLSISIKGIHEVLQILITEYQLKKEAILKEIEKL